MTMFAAFLDEFGHIGSYVSRNDPRYNTHPAFGLAGFVLPLSEVRSFGTWFYQLKCNTLRWEISQQTLAPAVWEKKGSAFFTAKNLAQYHEVRRAGFRLLNEIRRRGGFVFYVGIEKRRGIGQGDPKALYKAILRETIKRLDSHCVNTGPESQFLMFMDEHAMRDDLLTAASITMFSPNVDHGYRLVEPPMQVESHRYQTLQAADWIAGLVGRLTAYDLQPTDYADLLQFHTLFDRRMASAKNRSGIRRARP